MVFLRLRQRPHRDLVRHPVPEAVGQRVLHVGQVLVIPVGVVHPDLHRVRAGDVRHVEAVVEVVVPRVVVGADASAVVEAGNRAPLLVDADHDRIEVEALGLQMHVAPPLDAVNGARFEQHFARHRRRPVEQHDALHREPAVGTGLGRSGRADAVMAGAEVLLRIRHADLVLLVDLHGRAQLRVEPGLLERRRAAGIRDVVPPRRVVLVGVEEHALREQIRALRPAAGIEPRLVPLDRSADPGVEVPVLVDLSGVGEQGVAGPQRIVHVRRLHAVVGKVAEQAPVILVAAFPRDEVDADAAGGEVGVHRGGIEHHLLNAGCVRDRAAAPAAADHRAERDAVHHEPLILGPAAMRRQGARFRSERPADVLLAETSR